MDELKAIRDITETWENARVQWFIKEQKRYCEFSKMFEHEGDNYDDWSKEHIKLATYLRNGYKEDRGINYHDWQKIRYWDIEKFMNSVNVESDKRFNDIIDRVEKVVGNINHAEMLEFNVQNITRIKVYGTSADALVVVKFLEKNNQLQFKTFINEQRRYF